MKEKIDKLVASLIDGNEKEAFKYSDELARIGGEYVLEEMRVLLRSGNPDQVYLAARTLSKIRDNAGALDDLLEAIEDKKNKEHAGSLADFLEGFDCSDKFVPILRIYLFSDSFKVKAMAKSMLDYTEFEITPRVIRKAEKHWNHYSNNVKHDDGYAVVKQDIEVLLNELRLLFDT